LARFEGAGHLSFQFLRLIVILPRMKSVIKENKHTEVFVAVMGTSPAVLSECLYYYYSPYYEQNREYKEIKVITTSKGRDLLVQTLFDNGILSQLENALGLLTGNIPFTKSDIIVIANETTGDEIQDLLTSEENEAASNMISNWIKYYTDRDDVRLTATVAGGRKTQSAIMALAFQLYGRTQDELIHIIAPDERMMDREWFFPSEPADPTQFLSVSYVPVLRVGRYLSRNLNQSTESMVREIQESLYAARPIERIEIEKNILNVDGEEVKITPREASYYRYFLKRRVNASCPDDCPGCQECFADQETLLADSRTLILAEHAIISGEGGHFHRTKEKRQQTSDYELIPSLYEEISRLGSVLRNSELHPLRREDIAPKKLFLTQGNRKDVSIGIILNPIVIHFLD
jgi:CRISPR-associated protein (TIGR02584 family)